MNSNCLSRDGKILVSGIYGACPTKEHECDDIFLALISTTYFFSPPPHLNWSDDAKQQFMSLKKTAQKFLFFYFFAPKSALSLTESWITKSSASISLFLQKCSAKSKTSKIPSITCMVENISENMAQKTGDLRGKTFLLLIIWLHKSNKCAALRHTTFSLMQ